MWKRNIIIFIGIFLMTFLTLPFFNFYIDIARIFHKDYNKHYKNRSGNNRFLQTSFAIENSDKFHSFLIGSSRVGSGFSLDSEEGWYTLWYGDGNTHEHRKSVEGLIADHTKLKHIIIGIDNLDFFRQHKYKDYFRRPYPSSLNEKIDFYMFYLFRKPTMYDIDILQGKLSLVQNSSAFDNKGSKPIVSVKHIQLMKNIEMYKTSVAESMKEQNTENVINEIKKILELANKEDFTLSLFFHPFHYKNLLMHNPIAVKYSKKKLSEITSFYDFSGLNDFAILPSYWKESSHYTSNLGEIVFNNIQEKNNTYLVNRNNIDSFVNQQIDTLLQRIPTLLNNDMKATPHPYYLSDKLNYLIEDDKIIGSKINEKLVYSINLKETKFSNYKNYVIKVEIYTKGKNKATIKYEDSNKTILQEAVLNLNKKLPYTTYIDEYQTLSFVIHKKDIKNGFTITFDNNNTSINRITIRGLKESHNEVLSSKHKKKNNSVTRKNDLKMINNALHQYYKDNGVYPKSQGMDGIYTLWGKNSINWIQNLTPKYLDKLPRDPRNNEHPDQQYLYKSNGKDFKLISHNAEDCKIVKSKQPGLIDPKRDCWSYGYWTEGAKNW